MTLKQWQTNGWLKSEPTSRDEIANMLAMVDRDLKDAAGSISPDWRFGIAYNAALKLCTILVRAEGYRPAHGLQHYRAIMAMPLVLGQKKRTTPTISTRAERNGIRSNMIISAAHPMLTLTNLSNSLRS